MDPEGDDASNMEVDSDMFAMDTNGTVEGMAEDEGHRGGGEESSASPHQQVWNFPDGICRKTVMQRGEGVVGPVIGAMCQVNLQVLEHPQEFDISLVGYPLGESSIQLGEGDTPISRMIDQAFTSTKRGEISELFVSRVRGIGDLKLIITLFDFSSAVPFWRMTPVEKRTTATHHKEKGAQLFKDNHIDAAFARFSLATRLLVSIPPQELLEDDESTAGAHQTLLCQCYLNLAACQMKTGHHHHVVTNCSNALNLDSTNVKARYRRASAHINLGDYSSAKCDLEKGLSKEPCNKVLLELLQTVNTHIAQSESQMAQGLSKMFS